MRNRLTYFPQIYPGELIYSTIARYGYHTGYRMAHKLNAELFGRKGATTSFDLPTDLDNLCAILPEIRSIKSCDIINNNTLYRYYTAFVENDYRERVARAMSQSQTVGAKATVRRQSAANSLSHLRFCKECHADMQEKHNEYYWRPEHQLPLGLICHSHGSVLYESTVAVGRGLQNYEIPTNLNCVATDATAVMPPDKELYAIVQRITAESIRHLTATKPQEIFEFEPSFYTTKLQDLGFLIGNKYSNFDLIRSKARQHFGSLIKIRPDMDLSDLNRDSWLMLPTRQLSSNAHPLYHILLRDFLENQPIHNISDGGSKFWRSNIDTWPCYNPIIHHKTKPKVFVTNYYTFKSYTSARFKCECGYSYTIRRTNNGEFSLPTISEFGQSLLPFLQKAAEMRWSARRAAKELGIKGSTLKYQASLLGVDFAIKKPIKPYVSKRTAKSKPR